jgi:hypothetical protein
VLELTGELCCALGFGLALRGQSTGSHPSLTGGFHGSGTGSLMGTNTLSHCLERRGSSVSGSTQKAHDSVTFDVLGETTEGSLTASSGDRSQRTDIGTAQLRGNTTGTEYGCTSVRCTLGIRDLHQTALRRGQDRLEVIFFPGRSLAHGSTSDGGFRVPAPEELPSDMVDMVGLTCRKS